MTSMVLNQTTQNAISLALTGPGVNNQNYFAAYTAISNDIANRGFNAGTVNWFAQAGLVNTQAFNPSAAGTYIWNYTIAAAHPRSYARSMIDAKLES